MKGSANNINKFKKGGFYEWPGQCSFVVLEVSRRWPFGLGKGTVTALMIEGLKHLYPAGSIIDFSIGEDDDDNSEVARRAQLVL